MHTCPVLCILDTLSPWCSSPIMGTNPSAAPIEQTRALHWIALSLTPGLGPTRARHLVEFFGSIDPIFHSSLTSLEAAGIPAAAAQSLAAGKSLELADEELVRARAAGVTMVTLDDPTYPPQLRQIYDPPLTLYVRGNPDLLCQPSLALVGTRHPTPYGLGMAERLSCDLAARRLVIVSGLARGIDAAGHRAALAGRGKTVAIFGTGVDIIYPRENQRLADQILAAGGALCSEFPMATFAAPQNFPIRNRIISGLALGVLVIEAGEYSGTRITARCALEQNREMFAVPGNVTNRQAWGPNTLIKQGAKLVATWEDIWEELPAQIRLQLAPPNLNPQPPLLHPSLKRTRSLLTSGASSASFDATSPPTLTNWWNACSPSFLLRRFLPPCSNWSWRERCGSCRGKIL